jgi:hypothetical protein
MVIFDDAARVARFVAAGDVSLASSPVADGSKSAIKPSGRGRRSLAALAYITQAGMDLGTPTPRTAFEDAGDVEKVGVCRDAISRSAVP